MRTWRWLALAAVLGLVLAACAGPGTSPSAAGGSVTPSASAGPPFEATAYPVDGPAKCGADNNPTNISEIKATDEHTVVFTLCTPDVAFLAKVALLAETESHHPDINNSWNKVRLEFWTHTAEGLTRNDFIMAAKIDRL